MQTSTALFIDEHKKEMNKLQDKSRELDILHKQLSEQRIQIFKERREFEELKKPYITMEMVEIEREKVRVENIKLQQLKNKLKFQKSLLDKEKEEWNEICNEEINIDSE